MSAPIHSFGEVEEDDDEEEEEEEEEEEVDDSLGQAGAPKLSLNMLFSACPK